MRIYRLLLFIALSVTVNSFAQEPELYHRVKVNTGASGLAAMAEAGIAVDHGMYKKGVYFITDLSASEIEKVKTLGLSYTIEIEDVSKYYRERNKQPNGGKPTGAAGCIACETYATPSDFELGSMGGFFTYQEMLDILDSMKSKYPALVTTKQALGAATTAQGRSVYYVKISDNPGNDEPEPEVLYTAVHHAREPESMSQLIFYMWYLLENYNTDADIKYLVDHTEMYFVPCLNPDGYVFNQTNDPNGGGMWRKNRRNNGSSFGVDLNRNYGRFWGYDNIGSSPSGSSDTYRGPSGFSEPETQLIRDFCNAHQFRIALNAHTFSNLLIYPYGHIPSFETSDSLVFRHFAQDMAECSGFATGTGDQTVGYVSNGDSDDWMYDEQVTKGKIFSMTPEAGDQNDGFWPISSRIIPIAKQTMDQNLDAAKLATAYARVTSPDIAAIPYVPTTYVHFDFKRIGLENSTFTVSVIPLTNVTAAGGPKTFNSPAHLQGYSDSILININLGSLAPNSGNVIRYALKWENADGYGKTDTITREFGAEELVFYSDCNTLDSFVNNGWGISTSQFTTASGSITDSPNGDYADNSTTTITTKGEIDLTEASGAYLTFDVRWDIEKGFDYVMLEASENGTTFSPLCGLYTHKGNGNQDDVTAVYDGIQPSWVKEWIDLGDYLNKKIKLRFTLKTDPALEKDGFYFDEFKVHKVRVLPVSIADRQPGDFGLYNVPNPCSGNTDIYYRLPPGKGNWHLQLTDPLGRVVQRLPLDTGKQSIRMNVSALRSGIYFCRIVSEQNASAVIKIVVHN